MYSRRRLRPLQHMVIATLHQGKGPSVEAEARRNPSVYLLWNCSDEPEALFAVKCNRNQNVPFGEAVSAFQAVFEI